MKRIPVYYKKKIYKYALVDDQDYDLVKDHRWIWHNYGYAYCRKGTGHKSLLMHRLILGLDFGDKRQADHIDGNRLNNVRSNIRIVTAHEQKRNVKSLSRMRGKQTTSRYRGVCKKGSRWEAKIQHNGKTVYIGRFVDEKAAAQAYDLYSAILFGEHGCQNFPLDAGDRKARLTPKEWRVGA